MARDGGIMRTRFGVSATAVGILIAVLAISLGVIAGRVSAQRAAAPAAAAPTASSAPVRRQANGKPDFSGIWQANNTANWDLLTHDSRPMVAQSGVYPNHPVPRHRCSHSARSPGFLREWVSWRAMRFLISRGRRREKKRTLRTGWIATPS